MLSDDGKNKGGLFGVFRQALRTTLEQRPAATRPSPFAGGGQRPATRPGGAGAGGRRPPAAGCGCGGKR